MADATTRRGRLTVYLGFGPGVDKARRLADEARALRQRGVDVVLGGPSAASDVEAVPPRRITYRGVSADELDLEAVLARRPQVVVLEDLAQVNAPGGKHKRRHEDALALLQAGIDVVGALDVQQLRSQSDRVQHTLGLNVRNTVPDSFLDHADAVVALDAAADDPPGRTLRELLLSEVTERLARGPRTDARQPGERVMVCMSSSPHRTSALLRRGARLAGRIHSDWFAVHVQRPGGPPAQAEHLTLARELGAEAVALQGNDVASVLVDFARSHAVGHILLGRSAERWLWQLLRPSVMVRMVREAGDFDLQLVAERDEATP